MLETYNSKAIILSRQPYRENDLRVVLYSPRYGRMDLVVRSGLKMTSKLAGHVEPVTLADIMIIAGRKISYIGTSIARNCYINIKDNSVKLFYVGLVIKVVDKKTKSDDRVDSGLIFNLLYDYLEILETYELTQDECKLLYNFFILKFLSHVGFLPELNYCCKCQIAVGQGGCYFSVSGGGVVCDKCFCKDDDLIELKYNSLKVIKFVIKNDFSSLHALKVKDKNTFYNINHIISLFYKYYLE